MYEDEYKELNYFYKCKEIITTDGFLDAHEEYIEVNVSEYKAGKSLFSRNFASCVAVLAKLKDGNFVLYHSFSPNIDFGKGKAFIDYMKLRVTEINEILVFQKTKKINHTQNSLRTAKNIAEYLNIEVKLVGLENYKDIIISNNRLLLSLSNLEIIEEGSKEYGIYIRSATEDNLDEYKSVIYPSVSYIDNSVYTNNKKKNSNRCSIM